MLPDVHPQWLKTPGMLNDFQDYKAGLNKGRKNNMRTIAGLFHYGQIKKTPL